MNFAKLILSSSFLVACGGGAGSDSNVLPQKDPNGPPPASADLGTDKNLNKIPSEVVSSRGSSVENPSLNKGSSVDKANIDVKDLTSTEMDASPKDTENDSYSSDSSRSESRATSESASHSSTDASEVQSPLPAGEQPKSILKKGDRKSPDTTRTSPRKRMKNISEHTGTPLNIRKAFGKKISTAEMAKRIAEANAMAAAAQEVSPSPSGVREPRSPTPLASPSHSPKRLIGNYGAVASRKLRESDAQSGAVDLGEISKHYSLNMPLHIKVSAASNHLEARDKNSSLFYRSGNALLGVSHAFTKTLNPSLNHDSQKETSVVAACMTGPSFLELQVGAMSKHCLHDANWSGSQQILTAGYDCTSGITPFVQLAARQLLENNITHHQEHSAYVGFLLDSECKNDFYTSKSRVALKTGMVSDRHASTINAKAEHSLSVEHGLKLDTISFNTSLELSTKDSAQVNMSIGFSL